MLILFSDGLAQRAQILLQRSSTSLVLWRKEMEPHMTNPLRLLPDAKLQVTKVINAYRAPTNQTRALGPIQSILCECEPIGVQTQPCRRALFSFGRSDHASRASAGGKTLAEGSEVFLWKPWDEVVLSDTPTLLSYRFLIVPSTVIEND